MDNIITALYNTALPTKYKMASWVLNSINVMALLSTFFELSSASTDMKIVAGTAGTPAEP